MTCAEPGDEVPVSYVELQTCLDMQPGGSLTFQGPAAADDAVSPNSTGSPVPVARMPGQIE